MISEKHSPIRKAIAHIYIQRKRGVADKHKYKYVEQDTTNKKCILSTKRQVLRRNMYFLAYFVITDCFVCVTLRCVFFIYCPTIKKN